MRYTTLDIRFPPDQRHPMHAFLDQGDGWRSEMVSWNLTDPETFVVLFRIHAPKEPYLDALEAVDAVDTYEVAPLDDGSFYLRIHEQPMSADLDFRAAFAGTGLVAVPPLVYGSSGRLSLGVIGAPEELRAALASLPDGVEYDVSRVGQYRGGFRIAGADLTDRQREALQAAHDVGYYDVPRTGSVADVAAVLGCAKSTASRHLQKAESQLVAAYLDG